MAMCLIVDPEKSSCELMRELLKPYDFDLDVTVDADDALERCRRSTPDVVVFSEQQHGMDLATFMRRLNKTVHGRKPIVLMVCEEPDADSVTKAIWDGANACMVRPFDASVLDDKLHQAGVL